MLKSDRYNFYSARLPLLVCVIRYSAVPRAKNSPPDCFYRPYGRHALSNPPQVSTANKTTRAPLLRCSVLVGEGGFEPPKSLTTDLQSAPFGRSGILPYSIKCYTLIKKGGAGGRTRTPDLLITNQLLYQLSYTSV